MSVTLKSLGLDQLDVNQRLALVEELWDSIAAEGADLPLTPAQAGELDRRLTDHRATPDDVVPLEEVMHSLRAQLKE
ncbi:MAG: addiction module protein [Chromatiales bacterium]|nr:addiction module protein [Chromatiales bacterium]